MKNSIPILVVLLFIWVVGGSFLYNFLCCGYPGASFSVMDGETTVAKSSQSIAFGLNQTEPVVPEPAVKALKTVATYLDNNSEKVLYLTGYFRDSEESAGSSGPLGLRRAEEVKAYLGALGLDTTKVVLRSDIGGNELEVADREIYNAMAFHIGDIPMFSLSIIDSTLLEASASTNLTFYESDYKYLEPINTNIAAAFEKTAEYLKENPGRKIQITGLYSDSERNTSMLPDLGLARANQIKNYLKNEWGVPAAQTEIASELEENLIFPGSLLYGGAKYTFSSLSPAEYDAPVEKKKSTLANNSLVLFFETNRYRVPLTIEQRQTFAEWIGYLDNNAEVKVYVTGHTDNQGDAEYNRGLSEERADFIKKYLIRNGLNAERIITAGRGATRPIDTNNTKAGRAKNRRVEISVK